MGPDSEFKQTSELASSLLSALKRDTLTQGRILASQKQLEELEHNLLAGLALVATLKNASQTVNALLPVVLGHIFRFLQEEDSPRPEESNAPLNRWILVTHVCRHWRMVANETPSLWSRIHVHSNPCHVQYFLDKSLSMPLTVLCGSPAVKVQQSQIPSMIATVARALRAIGAHMTRVQELYFFSSFPVDAVLQSDQFSRIVLPKISSRLPSDSFTPPYISADIFAQFFSSPSPDMRKLSLHGLLIPYMLDSANQLNCLTHLALYEHPNWSTNQLNLSSNLDAFLDILQASSQSLQALTLIRAGPDGVMSRETSNSVTPKRRVVSLPAFISLEIGDWTSSGSIAYFLAHLVIPGNAKRCIWGDNLKYLSSILFPLDPDTAKTKRRGWNNETKRVIFTAIKGKDMIGIHNNTVYVQGHLDFHSIYPLFRDQPQIFECVEDLLFTSPPAISALTAEEYRLLFAALPNVLRLVMVNMDVSSIFQALGLFDQDPLSEPALPELRDITIQYSKPNKPPRPTHDDPLGNEYITSSLSSFMALAKLSHRRNKIGCPFKKGKFDFGDHRVVGDADGDYADILDYLRCWVEDFEQTFDHIGTHLVVSLLEGMWPSNASLGSF